MEKHTLDDTWNEILIERRHKSMRELFSRDQIFLRSNLEHTALCRNPCFYVTLLKYIHMFKLYTLQMCQYLFKDSIFTFLNAWKGNLSIPYRTLSFNKLNCLHVSEIKLCFNSSLTQVQTNELTQDDNIYLFQTWVRFSEFFSVNKKPLHYLDRMLRCSTITGLISH